MGTRSLNPVLLLLWMTYSQEVAAQESDLKVSKIDTDAFRNLVGGILFVLLIASLLSSLGICIRSTFSFNMRKSKMIEQRLGFAIALLNQRNHGDQKFNIRHGASALEVQQTVNQIWAEFDKDKSGFLDQRETKLFLIRIFGKVKLNKRFTESDFKSFYDQVDVSKDGLISKVEMRRFFMKLTQQTLEQKKVTRSHSIKDDGQINFEDLDFDEALSNMKGSVGGSGGNQQDLTEIKQSSFVAKDDFDNVRRESKRDELDIGELRRQTTSNFPTQKLLNVSEEEILLDHSSRGILNQSNEMDFNTSDGNSSHLREVMSLDLEHSSQDQSQPGENNSQPIDAKYIKKSMGRFLSGVMKKKPKKKDKRETYRQANVLTIIKEESEAPVDMTSPGDVLNLLAHNESLVEDITKPQTISVEDQKIKRGPMSRRGTSSKISEVRDSSNSGSQLQVKASDDLLGLSPSAIPELSSKGNSTSQLARATITESSNIEGMQFSQEIQQPSSLGNPLSPDRNQSDIDDIATPNDKPATNIYKPRLKKPSSKKSKGISAPFNLEEGKRLSSAGEPRPLSGETAGDNHRRSQPQDEQSRKSSQGQQEKSDNSELGPANHEPMKEEVHENAPALEGDNSAKVAGPFELPQAKQTPPKAEEDAK